MKQHRGQHHLVKHVIIRQVLHQCHAFKLVVAIILLVLAWSRHGFYDLFVLPPPNLRNTLYKTVNLAKVRGYLKLLEDLCKPRHDPSAQ